MQETNFDAEVIGAKYTCSVRKESTEFHKLYRFRVVDDLMGKEYNYDANIYVLQD